MERFPLEMKIPLDVWREIKTYIIHDIKTQSKHLRNYPEIINFNNVINDMPKKKYNVIRTENRIPIRTETF
jgi:hypothetical protein